MKMRCRLHVSIGLQRKTKNIVKLTKTFGSIKFCAATENTKYCIKKILRDIFDNVLYSKSSQYLVIITNNYLSEINHLAIIIRS